MVEARLITDTGNLRLEESGDSDNSDTSGEAGGEQETPVTPARGVSVPGAGARRQEESDMSQSYHEIFDTQPYSGQAHQTEQERREGPKCVEVYYSEGEGRLVSVSPPPGDDQPPMSQYLTSKLVADSLMWQQTFRNDSPSPEEPRPGTSLQRPTSLPGPASEPASAVATKAKISAVLDPGVINHIEKEARRLATDVDALVENLSCVLQSLSALTVEHVQTYRDGVCKTCDSVDSNIRAMYQLMAKWEELNKNMAPAYRISGQIKDIKRLLDLFEAALN